jgi:hypothetical protein
MTGNETTRRLNLVECLVFMAIGAAIGSTITYLAQGGAQSRSKLEAVAINHGMSKEQIRDTLGQPDDIAMFQPGEDFSSVAPIRTYAYSCIHDTDPSTLREVWSYGPFGAYQPKPGHITKFRLQIVFVADKVLKWSKSAPL